MIYILESGLCLSLFYLIYWAFLKKDTHFVLNRFFLITAALFAFGLPLIRITSPFAATIYVDPTALTDMELGIPARTFGVWEVLGLIYLAGFLFYLIRFIFKLYTLYVIVTKNKVKHYHGLKIVHTDHDFTPFSFFHYVFVKQSQHSMDDLKRILAHELVHIKQYHTFDLLIMELVTIFQWFNPFVWPYKNSLKATHEYLADHAVIAQGCSRARYQLLLFEQHVGAKLFEFANNFDHSLIKRRITMMTKNRSRKGAKLKVLLVLPVALLLVLVFADTKPVKAVEKANLDNTAFTTSDTSANVDQEHDEKAKKEKQKQAELEKKIAEIKALYEKTDDPEKKAKIKEKIMQLKKSAEKDGDSHLSMEEEYAKKAATLEEEYEKTDDPEKKKAIKEKLAQLQITIIKSKYEELSAHVDKIKKLMEETEDAEKKEKLKAMWKDAENDMKKLKEKAKVIEESNKEKE